MLKSYKYYFTEKTANDTCTNSKECEGKLLCEDGICQCFDDFFWNGITCIFSKLYIYIYTKKVNVNSDFNINIIAQSLVYMEQFICIPWSVRYITTFHCLQSWKAQLAKRWLIVSESRFWSSIGTVILLWCTYPLW